MNPLRAAEVLTREKCYSDAVSRTYYAALHAVKAALYIHDVTAESHAAAGRMFGLHLVRSGEVEPKWAAYLSESFDDRLAVDYDSEVSVSERDARENCRGARRFLNRIRRYLLDKGPYRIRTEATPRWLAITSGLRGEIRVARERSNGAARGGSRSPLGFEQLHRGV